MKDYLRLSALSLTFICFLLPQFSCGDYQKVLKGANYDEKWDMALKLYDNKQYNKALPLFEELLTVYRGTSKAEQLYFYYAFAHYGIEDFQSAQYYFDNFISTFPNSKYSEEAAYMVGYCLYKDSPRYNLDPTSTYRAINELQGFANRFPRSKRVEDCTKLIEELRGKLETKTYKLAMLYYHIENYQSAIIAFKNFTRDFPDTRLDMESSYYIFLSAYKYAAGSVDTKKKERYNDAIKYYYTFVERFPNSVLKKSADETFEKCQKGLKTLEMINERKSKEKLSEK
ncbi:MAG: outer membrane protein assembly factor BamD [Flavobacteriales bacterium]|nr:outer membrane protein assembly factor BamD [Flavobacteriales bacterium]